MNAPFLAALGSGDLRTVKELLDARSYTPYELREGFIRSLSHNRIPFIKLFISHGIDVNMTTFPEPYNTMLHFAAKSSHPRVVQILLEAGADPLAEDYRDRTPYEVASNPISARLLLEAERFAQQWNYESHSKFKSPLRREVVATLGSHKPGTQLGRLPPELLNEVLEFR